MSNLPEMKAPAGYIYRREKRDFGEYYDREELITCEDCKYWRGHKYVKETKRYIPFCGFNAIYTEADDFCSRAERKE